MYLPSYQDRDEAGDAMRALGSCSSASLNRDEAQVMHDDQMPPWGTRAILALAHGGVKLTGRLPGRIGGRRSAGTGRN